ncbi:uncharacterized protein LOC129726518 [Wyeomyia smithii]|uniref:uncharacterized protein LOC129726518 n=1 Tax=Wyeomyia smithii TaxID=174621 RepID=UPI002467CE23|nr:uncharacterized protein LOC129726518 [Wyeomyia smithii]
MVSIRIIQLSALLLSLQYAQGLNCNFCTSNINWEDCVKVTTNQTCNVQDVNALHLEVQELNPNFATVDPTASVEFQCMSIHFVLKTLSPGVSETPSSTTGIFRGCTFRHTKVCEGWLDPVVVESCATCDTDQCNSGRSVQPSVWIMLIGVYLLVQKVVLN